MENPEKSSIFVVENNRDMKKLIDWIKSTKWWMNRNNRKNKVEILTEEEYFLLWNGKVVEAL